MFHAQVPFGFAERPRRLKRLDVFDLSFAPSLRRRRKKLW
jgi:hypothetical protein